LASTTADEFKVAAWRDSRARVEPPLILHTFPDTVSRSSPATFGTHYIVSTFSSCRHNSTVSARDGTLLYLAFYRGDLPGWATGPTPEGTTWALASATYFCVAGPSIVIKYSPQQLGNAAEHTHGIYRDPSNDYGARYTSTS